MIIQIFLSVGSMGGGRTVRNKSSPRIKTYEFFLSFPPSSCLYPAVENERVKKTEEDKKK